MNKLNQPLLGIAAVLISSPAFATTAQIPEPNVLTLLGIGVVSAILVARLKARK